MIELRVWVLHSRFIHSFPWRLFSSLSSPWPPLYTGKKLLAANSRDTVRSRCMTGKPARQLRTAWTEAWDSPDSPGALPMPLQFILHSYAMRRAAPYELADFQGMPVGQVVSRMNRVRTTKEVVLDLVEEFVDTTERMHTANVLSP